MYYPVYVLPRVCLLRIMASIQVHVYAQEYYSIYTPAHDLANSNHPQFQKSTYNFPKIFPHFNLSSSPSIFVSTVVDQLSLLLKYVQTRRFSPPPGMYSISLSPLKWLSVSRNIRRARPPFDGRLLRSAGCSPINVPQSSLCSCVYMWLLCI